MYKFNAKWDYGQPKFRNFENKFNQNGQGRINTLADRIRRAVQNAPLVAKMDIMVNGKPTECMVFQADKK